MKANTNYGVSTTSYPFYGVEGFENLEYQKDTTSIVNVLSASMRETVSSVVFPTKMTSIGASAFENCKSLKIDITLPSTVTKIGDSAFKNSGITFSSVDLTGCTSYPSVGANAFTGTTVKKLIVGSSGVRANSNYGISTTSYPFYNAKGFESLEYEAGTTTACNVLTASMKKTLKTIKLAASITIFEDSVFENCNTIELEKELEITSKVTKIGSNAFKNSSLIFSSVNLTGCSTYPSVGSNAFTGTTVRKLVVDKNGVKANSGVSDEKYPFYGVKGFETLEYQKDVTLIVNLLSASMRETVNCVVFPTTITSFGASSFENCKNLKIDYTLPSSVTKIGDSAFKNSGITFVSVDLTGCTSSPSVGANAFSGTTVKKLIIDNNGVKANYGALDEKYPFYGVNAFETLEYKSGTTTARNVLSASMRSTITTASIPESVTVYASEVLADTSNLKGEFSIPSTVISIGDSAFKNSGLTFSIVHLTGCSSNSSVGKNAFTGTTVKILILNNNWVRTSYGVSAAEYPFYNVKGFEILEYMYGTTTARDVLSDSMRSSITTAYIPDSITVYASEFLSNTPNLKGELSLPSTVINIGDSAFKNCGLTFVSVDLSSCSSNSSVGKNAFTGTTVKKLIVNNNGVRVNSNYGVSAEEYPFYNVEGFTTLEYKKDTTTARNVLSDSMRKTLTEVTVPKTVTKIDDNVFSDCTLLEEISLPYGTVYEKNTFKNCKAKMVRY